MLLAPVLGIALALLLAGAINSLTISPSNGATYEGSFQGGFSQPTTRAIPTPMPTAAPQAASLSVPVSPFLFIAGAVIVGVLAVLLFFREKGLKKVLSE